MPKNVLTFLFFAFTVLSARIACAAGEATDEAAIRALELQQQEAWNRHDAKAYAALFTEEGDCVNVVGWLWKGRAEIEKKLTDAYVYVFQQSVFTLGEVTVRFLQ